MFIGKPTILGEHSMAPSKKSTSCMRGSPEAIRSQMSPSRGPNCSAPVRTHGPMVMARAEVCNAPFLNQKAKAPFLINPGESGQLVFPGSDELEIYAYAWIYAHGEDAP